MSPNPDLETEYGRLLQRAGWSLDDISTTLDVGDRVATYIAAHGSEGLDLRGQLDPVRRMRDDPMLAGSSVGVLKQMLEGLLVAAESRQLVAPFDLYAGEYPTHEVNGCILPVPGGSLLLLNSGFMLLAHQVAGAVAAFCISNVPKSGRSWPMVGVDRNSKELTSLSIANALIAYHVLELSIRPTAPMIPGLFQWLVSRLVWQEATRFVLAHELAHAVHGHIGKPHKLSHEFDADATAADLLVYGRPKSLEPALDQSCLHAALAGPRFFFSLCRLIELTEKIEEVAELVRLKSSYAGLPSGYSYARAERHGATHPTPDERADALSARQQMPKDHFRMAEAFARAFELLERGVIDNVRTWSAQTLASASDAGGVRF